MAQSLGGSEKLVFAKSTFAIVYWIIEWFKTVNWQKLIHTNIF